MIGIYKIVSPKNKVYIGQSWDIKKRWRAHKSTGNNCTKLSNSLNKHGNGLHDFKAVHELPCDIDQIILNTYEQLYMDAYRGAGVELLNLREGGSHGTHSLETRKIISQKGMGRKISDKQKAAMSVLHKGHKYNLGRVQSVQERQKRSLLLKNIPKSAEHNRRNSESKKGEKCYMYGIDPCKHPQAVKVRNKNTGQVYGTVTQAAEAIGVKRSTLNMWLLGLNKNKTELVYDSQ